MIKLLPMVEKSIGHLKQNYKVIVHIDKTKHAILRQMRHDTPITDGQIKAAVEKASKRIIHMLLFDEIDIGDRVVVHQITDDLNVVGQLQREGENVIRFEVVTVMREKQFRSGSPFIHVK